MAETIKNIAIVNRGEAAMRLIHAVREFNREHDLDLKTIALYTDVERRAMFVREADIAVSIGAPSFVDANGDRKNSYLNYAAIEEALVETAADAVWVGWGFVAEHPEFADLCERKLGLTFIGPDGDCMRRLGDKIMSKTIAEEAGVPVAPWSGGPVKDLDEARTQAKKIGFPLMVKATAGGGGRGIRSARHEGELDEAFERASSEALKGFGNATVFMESLVEGARHIEVQVIADNHGNVWSVGVRDCSVQRRNQKLIEESSSPVLNSEQEEFIKAAAARLCKEAGYRNAGTVEFLYDPKDKTFAFMEVNARLQVEHPVTEATTDLDLVKMQLHIARGGRLEGEAPPIRGIAIEIRLNAEDPENDFAPSPGKVQMLRLPTGAGIRVDTGVEQGDQIPAEFDSMIAKIIAHGRDRDEALSRLRRALQELAVVIQGGSTNRAFLLELLNMPSVIEGRADVGWLDREPPSQWTYHYPGGEIALALAAIHVYEEDFDIERTLFMAAAARGRPKLRGGTGLTAEVRHGGNLYRLQVYRYGGDRYRVDLNGEALHLEVEKLGEYERRITCSNRVYRSITMHSGFDYLIEIDGQPHRISRDDGGLVRSPTPAMVVSVRVKEGDEIEQGDTLAILEAMKMEMRVPSPFAGTVRKVEVAENEQVDAGAPLLRLMPTATEEAGRHVDRLDFASLSCVRPLAAAVSAPHRCTEILHELQNLILGFDVQPEATSQLLAELRSLSDEIAPDDVTLRQQEDLLLARFADLSALSRRQPAPDSMQSGLPTVTSRSQQKSLFTYMRALEAKGEGLSKDFVYAIKTALRHYGIQDLEPTQALKEALLWLFKSHSRVDHQLPVVIYILERRLAKAEALIDESDGSFRALLERLITVSQGRYASVADMAREVRYEYFDKPLLDAARNQAYQRAAESFEAITSAPSQAEYQQHMEALVECPQPLMTVLSKHFVEGDQQTREAVIECLTRRYYRTRALEELSISRSGNHPFVVAKYGHDDNKRIQLVTTHTTYEDLTHTGNLVLPLLAETPDDHDIVMDFYIHRKGEERSEEDTLTHVRKAIEAIPFPRAIRRIVASVRIPGAGLGVAGQRFFTFRPSAEGYREEEGYRGLHPMMWKRLHLERFRDFKLERLPSIEDVYLFHAKARDNTKDERLFAVAEVRDLTAVRDVEDELIGLPQLERQFQETLAGIRLFQSHRSTRQRLHWNRIVLYLWPPLAISPEDRSAMVQRLFPEVMNLGLEKVVIRGRMAREVGGEVVDTIMSISNPTGSGPRVELLEPEDEHRVQPLSPYLQKVLKMRQRGLSYPYEIINLMTPDKRGQSPLPPGQFTEYDLSDEGMLEPVERPYGANSANIVVGTITNTTDAYPEGITRVIILGDPTRGMCPLAEPECSRIIAALDMAEQMNVPAEWFAVSAGAKIAMDSGTENLDWTAAVLRRIIEFTQAGCELNVVVHGINVGAQSYWNAEATMLMHTRGILIMTPTGAMVLTGKQALDYSGGVSAEDNFGIGGYDRVMGPNGQAQYWAADIDNACRILLSHYEHTYTVKGERFPRRISTSDPADRDISLHAYTTTDTGVFRTVGEIFSDEHNPGRKKPFEIRRVMRAVVDLDHEPMERWSTMQDAELGVVWDARLGGYPVCLIGIESKPLPRAGFVPADGPDQWTAGTLFPQSSRKVARAINASSGVRPLVVLANLSGFDGSPESMRNWQLEYGAEIGRAVVNFEGPIVFCVVSRYHGGAFVVFSKSLNRNLEVAALEGSYASVIGGAPAAGVVFVREVRKQTMADPRIEELGAALKEATGPDRVRLRAEYNQMLKTVTAEKRGELADKFDSIHSVYRAKEVGSVDHVIAAGRLRPYLIEAVERGVERTTEQAESAVGTGNEHTTPAGALSDSAQS